MYGRDGAVGMENPAMRTRADAERPGDSALLVDRHEAARLLGVSPGTIDNLRARGELPSVKIAARRLYDLEDLRAYIAARKEGGE